MRIGYLHAWRDSAENQAFQSLAIAGQRIGHTVVHCANSSEVEAAGVDFVLAASASQPKLNDVPTYSVLHQPRDAYLSFRTYFDNVLTYDGYLTISDSIQTFMADLLFAVRRDVGFGFYYNSCQSQAVSADLADLIRRKALRVTYFGTNWDRRRHGLFKRLSKSGAARIFGPETAWAHIDQSAYGGCVPFDGESVQQSYRENGVGLCILSEGHLAEDVISNRIFETTSVGAVAICCDTPWIRKHFGDSVYYIDQHLRDDLLAAQILGCLSHIYANPREAIAKADQARRIFEAKFSAEVLLGNAIAYHKQVQQDRRSAITRMQCADTPVISVIIRCLGRSPSLVRRAVQSVLGQSVGRFELVFVSRGPIDPIELGSIESARVVGTRVIEVAGDNRSNLLWAGLRGASGDYICVLDETDYLFSDHFERMLTLCSGSAAAGFFGYSGSIIESTTPWLIDHGVPETRKLYGLAVPDGPGGLELAESLVTGGCLISRDLLDPELLIDPEMSFAEDKYLILSLLNRAEATCSFQVTAVHDGSRERRPDTEGDVARVDEIIRTATRLFGRGTESAHRAGTWRRISELWTKRAQLQIEAQNNADSQVAGARFIVRAPASVLSMTSESERVLFGTGFVTERSSFAGKSRALDPAEGHALIEVPANPWDYGAQIALPAWPDGGGEFLIVVEFEILKGEIGIGLLNAAETEFVYRRSFAAVGRRTEFHIPVQETGDVGRLVVHNWETAGEARVEVHSVAVFKPIDEMNPPARR